MDKEWEMSSGSKYAPSKTRNSTEGTASMVDDSCEAVGSLSSEGEDAEEVHADSAEVVGRGKVGRGGRNPQWRVGDGGGRQLEISLCLIRREGV